MTKLLDLDTSTHMTREHAAARLREIADQLERHNDLEFNRDGLKYTVDVPREVKFELELELDDDGGELEIEISW